MDDTMRVKINVAVFFRGKLVHHIIEETIKGEETLNNLFKRIDKSRTIKKNFFKHLFKSPYGLTILLNGQSLNFPSDLESTIQDGDEISVLSTIAGG